MDIGIGLALHVTAVVLWIGGVGLVTTALLPALRRMPNTEQRIAVFEAVERRFGRVARFSVILAGLTGFYMVFRLDAWAWFAALPHWWMSTMVLVWLLFVAMLFVVEPLFLRRRFAAKARANPDVTFRRMHRLLWALLLLSLLTILGAVAGTQGVFLFG